MILPTSINAILARLSRFGCLDTLGALRRVQRECNDIATVCLHTAFGGFLGFHGRERGNQGMTRLFPASAPSCEVLALTKEVSRG